MKAKYLFRSLCATVAASLFLFTIANADQVTASAAPRSNQIIKVLRSESMAGTINILRRDDLTIDICTPKSGCLSRTMPRQLGSISSIVQGEFVPPQIAITSWIARSKNSANLCYSAIADASIICTRINAPPITRADISFSKINGHNALMIVPQLELAEDRNSRSKIENAIKQFTVALGSAGNRLAEKAKSSERDIGNLNEINDGGITVQSIDDSGGCDECGDEGGGGGGDIGGGWGGDIPPGGDTGGGESGGGEPGWTCIGVGPSVVCTQDPPPLTQDPFEPPLPAGPSDPWYCQWFGLFCPGTPEPTEPTTPPVTTTPPSTSNPPITTPPISNAAEEEYERDMADCYDVYERDMEECSAYYLTFGPGTYGTCKDRAGAYLAECQTQARNKLKASQ